MMSEPTPDKARIDRLFAAALELPAAQRSAFLDKASGGEQGPELRAAVEELLRLSEEGDLGPRIGSLWAGELLRTMADEELGATDRDDGLPAGTPVGSYRICAELGRGGMGVVYLADRVDGGFEQRVAIKVLQRGLGGDLTDVRFDEERAILASLNHPHIARLYDGGTTDDGRPYFSMEHVEGMPIDAYCRQHQLTVDERLALFQKVADAVRYAHGRLVVHRDIKPLNILVTADGEPKLLDFGIARLIREQDPRPRVTTRLQRRLTPEYASPELLRGEIVTTASDIYQLGLVLYELLTGRAAHRIPATVSPAAWEEVVCRTEPQAPSAAVARTAGPATAGMPSSTALARALRGDLDKVVLKALRKNPERRYASVGEFAEDIQRLRSNLPVRARKPTLGYRARKFARRHRAAVAAASVVLLSLIAGVAGMYWQASIARAERDRAQTEAATATRVTEFLVDLFRVADPSESKGETVTARELLARGSEQVESRLEEDPAVRARLLDALGRVHHALGLHTKAGPLLERGLTLRRQIFGPNHLEVTESLFSLASFLCDSRNCIKAEPLYREGLEIRRQLLGATDPRLAPFLTGLGKAAYGQGDFDQAERLLRQALSLLEPPSEDHRGDLADALGELAVVLHARGELDTAGTLYQRALTLRQAELGDEHPQTVVLLSNLASLEHARGDRRAAEPLMRRSLAAQRKIYGDRHERVATVADNLGLLLAEMGEFEEAEELTRMALAIRVALRGEDASSLAMPHVNVGYVAHQKGDLAAAESSYARAVALALTGRPDHPQLGVASFWYGKLLAETGHRRQATPHLRRSLEVYRGVYGEQDEWSLDAQVALGTNLAGLGETIEAEDLLRSAADSSGLSRESRLAALETLTSLYESTGQPAQAANYRALLTALRAEPPE